MHMRGNQGAVRMGCLCWIVWLFTLYNVAGQENIPLARRILTWSDEQQRSWLDGHIEDGLPTSNALSMLVKNKPDLVLPVLEAEIEKVLQASDPQKLFKHPSVNPEEIVELASATIATSGSELSLKLEGKLMRLNSSRFKGMVAATLASARSSKNAYTLAYGGFALGDDLLNQEITDWVKEQLSLKDDYSSNREHRAWAKALIATYKGLPTVAQFANDPISRSLAPAHFASIESEIRGRMTSVATQSSLPVRN